VKKVRRKQHHLSAMSTDTAQKFRMSGCMWVRLTETKPVPSDLPVDRFHLCRLIGESSADTQFISTYTQSDPHPHLYPMPLLESEIEPNRKKTEMQSNFIWDKTHSVRI